MKQSKTFSSGFSVEETIETLRQHLAEKDAEFAAYKRSTNLAYKGSEQETLDKLAASQAREVQLQEALHSVPICYHSKINGKECACGSCESNHLVEKALALPQDTTALEAMIAEAGEVMRERCSDSAQAEMDEQYIDSSPWYAARACREAIRDIPCVTLEDLQWGPA